jgi:uncharacterized glyoxalase superfamily protein PhnB
VGAQRAAPAGSRCDNFVNRSAIEVPMMSLTTERTKTVTSMYPRLVVADAARAIDFYVSALGAVETARHTDDNGKVIHSGLKLGSMMFAVKDEDAGDPAPTTLGGSPVILALDVTDADAVGKAMVAAGATVIYPIRDWERCPSRAAADPSATCGWSRRCPPRPAGLVHRRRATSADQQLGSNWLVAGQIPAVWDP